MEFYLEIIGLRGFKIQKILQNKICYNLIRSLRLYRLFSRNFQGFYLYIPILFHGILFRDIALRGFKIQKIL
jgi:hypothetical protein